MRVRVKDGATGFFGGKLVYGYNPEKGVRKSDEFTLVDKKHSTDVDKNGDPVIITAKQQFSGKWMEKVEEESTVVQSEIKPPSEMKVTELKNSLESFGVEIPEGAKKQDLIDLLESHLNPTE